MKIPRFVTIVAALNLSAAFSSLGAAQPAAPQPPATYQIVLRYRIAAARDQHVLQYDAMIAHLKKLSFQFDPPLDTNPQTDREDPSKNYLKGTVASDKLLKLLNNPSIASVLVLPESFVYPPKDLDKVVRIRLELAGGLGSDRQRELAEQVRAVLLAMNFREAAGYDHHGYDRRPFTRLVGTISQGRLEVLLKDLRGQPAGWFTRRLPPGDLPSPLRNINPIRIIEVLSDSEPIAEVARPPARSPEYLDKISPDLWSLIGAKDQGDQPVHIEIIWAGMPSFQNQDRGRMLQEAAPGAFVEGQLGQVVNAVVRQDQVKSLAALAPVLTLRLPSPARVDIVAGAELSGDNVKALSLTGLNTLHAKGYRGKGVRLGILDTDFRGWTELVKMGKLPAGTHLIDLTTLHDPNLYPAPAENTPGGSGAPATTSHGAQCARAAALAAPDADMALVRIDALSPYEIDDIISAIRGGGLTSPYIDRRRDELATARAELNRLRAQVQLERRVILDNYVDEIDLQKDFGFLGPVYGWVFSSRTWSRERVAYVDKREKVLAERNRRFFNLMEDIHDLDGITIVANPLVWNDGFALGAASPLSRAFDRVRPVSPLARGPLGKSPLLWFQAAGNTRGQSWAGSYHDEDGNGIMEFAPPGYQFKKGQWTTELNFLAWKPFAKEQADELAAGTQLRICLQWREPHDPDYFAGQSGQDSYRKPLADLRISLLRQRDPTTKTLPADAFDLVATSGIPQRLEHETGGSIYEVVLETALTKAGRYAVRVERPVGQQWVLSEDPVQKRPLFVRTGDLRPSGLRPLGAVTLPALEKHWELEPRLFVGAVGPGRLTGRPVFADFATDQGSVGVPADARSVITLGAADWQDQRQPYSAGGPLAFAELAKKPTLLAYDELQLGPAGTGGAFGTSVATSFAAGTAAALISGGMTPDAVLRYLRQQHGGVLKVPVKGQSR